MMYQDFRYTLARADSVYQALFSGLGMRLSVSGSHLEILFGVEVGMAFSRPVPPKPLIFVVFR